MPRPRPRGRAWICRPRARRALAAMRSCCLSAVRADARACPSYCDRRGLPPEERCDRATKIASLYARARPRCDLHTEGSNRAPIVVEIAHRSPHFGQPIPRDGLVRMARCERSCDHARSDRARSAGRARRWEPCAQTGHAPSRSPEGRAPRRRPTRCGAAHSSSGCSAFATGGAPKLRAGTARRRATQALGDPESSAPGRESQRCTRRALVSRVQCGGQNASQGRWQ
jgi:hypothetical protein